MSRFTKILFLAVLASSVLFAATFTVPSGNQLLANGSLSNSYDVVFGSDNTTFTLGGTSAIQWNSLTINNKKGIKIVLQDGASLEILGNVTINGSELNGVEIDGRNAGMFMINSSGNATTYIKNAKIHSFGTTLRVQNSGGTLIIEKSDISGAVAALHAGMYATNITALFSKFSKTGTDNASVVYVQGAAPLLEFCYFYHKGGGNHITHLTSSPGSVEGSFFQGGLKLNDASGSQGFDTTPLSTAGDPLATDFANALTFTSGASDINFDKYIPPNTYLNIGSAGLTIPANRILRVGYDFRAGNYPGGSKISIASGGKISMLGSSSRIYLQGPVSNRNELTGGGLLLGSGSGLHAINNTIFNNYATAVEDQAGNRLNLYNCLFSGSGTTALLIGSTSDGTGKYHYNTFQATGAGLDIAGGATVTYNFFATALSAPIIIRGSASPTIKNNTINYANGGYGVSLNTTGAPVIASNAITGTGVSVRVNNAGSGTTFSGNAITGNVQVAGGSPAFTSNPRIAGAVMVSGGAPVFSSNASITGPIQVSNGSPVFNANAINASDTTGTIQLTGGSSITFTGNTISGYSAANRALYLNGGALANFSGNVFTAANPKVHNNTSARYVLENNYWGAATPATVNFSGLNASSEIDYEPWWSATGGQSASQAPRPPTAPAVNGTPSSNYYTVSPVSKLAFYLEDIGYHAGTPLSYNLEIATDPAFNSKIVTARSAARYARGSAAEHTLVPPISGAGAYYWRVQGVNVLDTAAPNGEWPGSPGYFTFNIRQAQLTLTVTANRTMASAGEQVDYRINFSNPENINLNEVIITAILPDDVYWNGNVQIYAAGSNVAVKAFADLNGNVQVATYTGAAGSITMGTAANRHTIKRLELSIPALSAGTGGYFIYQTIVK